MLRGLQGWHFVILVALLIILFGWKRLPDAARSVGRSMRIFKSEVDQMKSETKAESASAASSDTVAGSTIEPGEQPPAPAPNVVGEDAPKTDNRS